MLVTFQCKSHADITYFGDIAEKLLGMMGHSGTVPGAILAEDVPAALDRLQAAVAADKVSPATAISGDTSDNDADEPPVSLVHRAMPLIELLQSATSAKCDVMWDK